MLDGEGSRRGRNRLGQAPILDQIAFWRWGRKSRFSYISRQSGGDCSDLSVRNGDGLGCSINQDRRGGMSRGRVVENKAKIKWKMEAE